MYIYIYVCVCVCINQVEELSIYDNVITMTRKFGKHSHVTYGTLRSCLNLIWSHQQCIPRSPPLEIEPATTGETLPLGHRSMPHISDGKSTSHGYCAICFLLAQRYVCSQEDIVTTYIYM